MASGKKSANRSGGLWPIAREVAYRFIIRSNVKTPTRALRSLLPYCRVSRSGLGEAIAAPPERARRRALAMDVTSRVQRRAAEAARRYPSLLSTAMRISASSPRTRCASYARDPV